MDEARTLSAVATAQGRVAPMGFRINPDVSAGTHAKITTGTADNKFGVPSRRRARFYAEAAVLPGLAVHGITVHIGSQLVSLDPLEQAFRRLGELIAALRAEAVTSAAPTLAAALACRTGPASPSRPAPPSMARWCGG
jgi:diaminopimelate decarboxylase